MAKADLSIDPRILASAKAEFLDKGFEKSSLKVICENAQVTTGALYKRYRGKEDLFHAVVAETVNKLNEVAKEKTSVDLSQLPDEALVKAWDMNEDYMLWWFQLLYEHREGFTLLLRCADGTVYANFQHDWVELMAQGTWRYYQEARRRGLTATNISQQELHVLLSAFWTTIYEPFIHDYSWEMIASHCHLVCGLFNWYRVLGFQA